MTEEEEEKNQFLIKEDEDQKVEIPDPRQSILPEVAEEEKDSQFGDYGESSGTADSSFVES